MSIDRELDASLGQVVSDVAHVANLVGSWLPALDGAVARLERGAKVADVGCGPGASTILMAKAFPRSRLFGFDAHAHSIGRARERAAAAGVQERVTFDVARAPEFPGHDYDLVAHLDWLYDMADPVGAARRAREALSPDGLWMIVEPLASDPGEAGEARLRAIASAAGFRRFRRAARTRFDLVLEARP
jgi:trans-aconitate methyltransferase